MNAGKERRPRLLRAAGLATAAVVAAALVLIIAVSENKGRGGNADLEEVRLVEEQLEGVPQHGMVVGEPGAPVTVIEFGDLQCPVCRAFAEAVLPRVIAGQVSRGEAKLEFRNFTVVNRQSVLAGAAALAAGEQGRGWSFLELFYRNQGKEGSGYVTDKFLTAIARGAKVPDIARWNAQRHSKRLLREVERTGREASDRYEFGGPPSFLVEGPGGTEALGTPESVEEIEAKISEAQ